MGSVSLWISFACGVLGFSCAVGYNISSLNLVETFVKCWLYFYDKKNKLKFQNLDYADVCQVNSTLFNDEGLYSPYTTQWALLSSAVFIGALFGPLISPVADRFGRLKAAFVSGTIGLLGAVLTWWAISATDHTSSYFLVMVLGRILTGVMIGCSCAIGPIYLIEIAPPDKLNFFGAAFTFGLNASVMVVLIIGLPEILGTASLWPLAIGLGCIPALIQMASNFIAVETPKVLISMGHINDAERSHHKLYGIDHELPKDMASSPKEAQPTMEILKEVFTDPGLLRTFLTILILGSIMQNITGIPVLLLYSGSIFRAAGIPSDWIGIAAIGLQISCIISNIITLKLFDVASRRICYLCSILGMTIAYLVLFILGFFESSTALSVLSIVCTVAVMMSANLGLMPLPYMLPTLWFPTKYCGTVMALLTVIGFAVSFTGSYTFPLLLEAVDQYAWILFFVICAAGLVYAWFRFMDEKGSTPEEIQRIFRNKSSML